MIDLIKQILRVDPTERPSVDKILEHPIFAKLPSRQSFLHQMAILEGELEETQPTQDEEIDGIEKRKPA